MATPTLNWKETARLAQLLKPEIEGLFVDRIIVPERPSFAAGSLKSEWSIRLTGRRAEAALIFSVRPRHPYVTLCANKGPKAAPQATHSPFTLGLNKYLKGAKILGIEALERERMLVLWMTVEGSRPDQERLGLVFCLIPAVPEALLVRVPANTTEIKWPILNRSRTLKTPEEFFTPPTGAQPPADPVVRTELLANPESFHAAIESELSKEAFEQRLRTAERELKDKIKQAKERIRQSSTALKEAEQEANWQQYGELLKNAMPDVPETSAGRTRTVKDYATDTLVEIPCDPKLGAREQIEKFFSLARRKSRRAEEARMRIETFEESKQRWENSLAHPPVMEDWAALEKFEKQANILPQNRAQATVKSAGGGKGKISSWLGKIFVSKDGLSILAGRSKDENLELTFKHARGNDVWLHVRGRPGAHVLVPLANGKSAPLETLLDAATMAIYYSGGESWGKTEVDYTFKKYVKRIKDSSEASYTNNKTLLVEPDPARIKRLLNS